ncbi:uncharacterized protein [Triticum aestivum]|uniref:uncharacterized protein isoform X1 n=1 Tax=Triticum aestivum TaxID=4565 RepID=UPI001D02CFAC|nr:uncharacterized protein LOC123044520 isoform X1 [Triticum aestivum]
MLISRVDLCCTVEMCSVQPRGIRDVEFVASSSTWLLSYSSSQPSLPSWSSVQLLAPTSVTQSVQDTRVSPPDPAQLSPFFSIFDCRMILVLGARVHVLLPGYDRRQRVGGKCTTSSNKTEYFSSTKSSRKVQSLFSEKLHGVSSATASMHPSRALTAVQVELRPPSSLSASPIDHPHTRGRLERLQTGDENHFSSVVRVLEVRILYPSRR